MRYLRCRGAAIATLSAPALEPFWASTLMRGESLFFVKSEGEDTPTAQLLFPPDQVLAITNVSGEMLYAPDRDFFVDSASGLVRLPPGSRIPFTTTRELYLQADPNDPSVMHTRDDRGTCLLFSDEIFYRRQTLATYAHQPGLWRGVVPRFAGAELPRVSQCLREKVPLTICLTGDSISEGYNASGFMQAAPFQPSYGPLVAEGLRAVYGAPIAFHNCATAGWNSDEAVWDAERLGGMRPDLVIIAYGMNDAGYNDASDFSRNIARVIHDIRRGSPEAEFVLVSSMLPHAQWEYPVMARFAEYRDALAGVCGAGVALADMTALWTDLLVRKSSLDLSGNGINHPNDFGHRLYAQVILALLVPPMMVTAIQSVGAGESANVHDAASE